MYYRFNESSLNFEKVSISNTLIFGIGVGIGLLVLLGFTLLDNKSIENLSPEEKLIILTQYNEFTEDRLVENIKNLNFRFPHIVMAQAIQETGNFKSNIFLENHNLFGMKQAKIRITLARGTNRNHAYYHNWQESLYDYAIYCSTYLSKVYTEEEYFTYLEQNYAEDTKYVSRLKNLINIYNLKEKF
jgi:hypothetical protein